MNYQKIYDSIIINAQLKNRKRMNRKNSDFIYYELHHIIPKSMGGSNDKTNLVFLTAKEHYLSHLLLWKIHKNWQMTLAAFIQQNINGKRITGKIYEVLKTEYGNIISQRRKGKPVSENTLVTLLQLAKDRIGKSLSDETKCKISDSKKKYTFTDEHRENIGKTSKGRVSANKGKSMTDEQKIKIGIANSGKIMSDETKLKMSLSAKGKFKSIETKKNMSDAAGNRPPMSDETKKKISNTLLAKKAIKDFSIRASST